MAASPLCRVSEDELKSLAASIGPDRYQAIGAVLGFDSKTLNDMDKIHGNRAVLRILIQWVEQQSEAEDVRGRLAEKLKETGLETAEQILPHEAAHGTSSTFELDDKLLVDLADDIETDEQIEKLGVELGFIRAALNRYRETSRQEGRVTSKGTRDMLFDWRQKTEPAKQQSELALALRRSQLVRLAAVYVPGILEGSTKGDSAAQNCIPSLSDRLIADIASAIETPEHVESLGITLGFNRAELIRYQDTNRVEGRVTCRGTRDMLYDWRQKVPLSDQRPALRRSLMNSGLVMLADQHLKGPILLLDEIKITENFTAGDCRRRLIHHYKTNVCKVQMKPWDKSSIANVEDIFTVVTMYKKDTEGKNLGEREKVTLQGSVDEIFKTKVNGLFPYRIVIFAAAGKGKTTAVAKMAHDWVHQIKGSAFEDLPLLFIVKLRYPNQRMSLGEAIIAEYLSEIDGLVPMCLEKFVKNNQQLCWVVLDGLDEYSGSLRQNPPLRNSIIATMKNEDLPECRVVVTSRPHLESDFDQGDLPRIYAKMVIEGFDEKQSRIYIDKFFGDSVKGQSLKLYLHNADVINELVSTPLLCSMVCYLWQADLLDGIDTQTKLFDNINHFLWHHSQQRKSTFDEDQLRETLKHLGKIALHGLLDDSNKLIFTPEDFRKKTNVLAKGCELGIISETVRKQSCELPVKQQQTKSQIEFYHKLAQEHAAGKYLGGKANKYLMRFKLSKLDMVFRRIRSNLNGYENLLRFTAGTNNRTCFAVMQAIISNKKVEKNEQFRMLFDCSSESPTLEGKVSSAVRGCIRGGSVAVTSPTVYTAIGMMKLPDGFKNEITNVTIERPQLAPPLPGKLSDGLKTLPQLQHLTISHPTKVHALPHVTTMSSLKLEGLPSTCNDWEWLQDAGNLTELHVTLLASDDDAESEGPYLHLIDGKITSSKMSQQTLKVFEHLQRRTSMKIGSVELQNCKLTASLSERLSEGLQSLPQLDHVTVSQPSVIQSLPTFGSISSLKLQDFPESFFEGHGWLNGAGDAENLEVTFTVSGDVSGSRKERKSESSLHLTQGQMTLSNAAEKTIMVVENLPQDISYKIHHLCLEHTHLSLDLTHRQWSCLAAFSSLADLTIKHSSLTFSPRAPTLPSIRSLTVTDISADSYRGLVRSLPRLDWISPMESQRIDLELSEDEGTLYRLSLNGVRAAERRVSSETMRVLCEAVRGITSLRVVRLWWLVIDEEDLIRLMEVCRTVRAVESINLHHCGSQPRGRLHAHVQRVRHPPGRKDGIRVWIRHGGFSTNEAYVPHVQ